MREKPITVCLALLSAILLPLLALSQAAPQNLTLDMNGQQTQLPVKQLNGRNYVEVEALARAANGSVSFQGNAMRLTLPGSGGSSAAPSTQQAAPPANPGFSKEFSRAGIEAMAAIREWRSVLTNGVQNGYPIQSLGLSYYETQAQQALRLASVAANTDSDRNAYQLGASEFANMKKLSDKYIATAQSLTYIAPDSLSSDPLDQKVIACARSLAAMASSGQFTDDGSCH
jgi:hypothetical protein